MPAAGMELTFIPQSAGLMSMRNSRFEQCLQDLCEDQGAKLKRDCFSLGVVCALEESDLLPTRVDFLGLPVPEPVNVPTIFTLPTLASGARRLPSLASLRRRHGLPSLASLRQQHVHSTVKKPGKVTDETQLNWQLDAGWKNSECVLESTCQELGSPVKINSPFLTPHTEAKVSQMTTTTQCGGPLGNSANHLHFSRDPEGIVNPKLFLAGAASLGLRRMCNKAIVEPPRHNAAHVGLFTSKPVAQIGKTLKDEVCIDEGCTAVGPQPQIQETIKVPHAPCKPKPQGYGNRPQICGARVLVNPQG